MYGSLIMRQSPAPKTCFEFDSLTKLPIVRFKLASAILPRVPMLALFSKDLDLMAWPTSQQRLIAKTRNPLASPPKPVSKPKPQDYAKALGGMK